MICFPKNINVQKTLYGGKNQMHEHNMEEWSGNSSLERELKV